MNLTQLISSVGGGAALIAMIVWLLQKWIYFRLKGSIQHEYDLKIEKLRADLKRDYDVQLANLNAEFVKNQLRFSHIHKHTADTIVAIYRMMVKLKENVHTEISLTKKTDKWAINQRQELDKKRKEFYSYFVENKIYLPRRTAQKINDFSEQLVAIPFQYDMALSNVTDEASYQKLMTSIDSLFNKVPRLLGDLEDDFEKILGLDDIKGSKDAPPDS